jgi:protein-L-isoaspartate(D-aspartate) O-methyltransferase
MPKMVTPDELQLAKRRMLERQLRRRGISSPRVLEAMERVPRERFVGDDLCEFAYDDRAMAIECDQTISQPYMVAAMTQSLELSGNESVLEIGTGSGYQTAILAELARHVTSVERHAELSALAAQRLTALGYRNVTLAVGDGTLGWPDAAPFDRIIVTAAARHCPPALWEQLVEGGILVIPLGDAWSQTLQAIRKIGGRPAVENIVECRFVPLIGAQGWPDDQPTA